MESSNQSPFLFYVVFGAEFDELKLSGKDYRCQGIPENMELSAYGPDTHPEVLDQFREGYLWEQLKRENPSLADEVASQTKCVVLQGHIRDQSNLNYFRDCIGLITWMIDKGGVAVYDPQSFKWWSKREWREKVFDPAKPVPREHVVILLSEETGGSTWFHTRGLRKYGRPDLSIHNVNDDYRDAVIDLCNRFIEMQAFGHVIKDGQPINMDPLPEGMYCINDGNEEDPDFNNFHVEIKWS